MFRFCLPRYCRWRVAVLLLATLVSVSCGSSESTPTEIEVTGRRITYAVKRLGINLASNASYGSGQMTRNLLYRNPGFEGDIHQSIVRCESPTESTCLDTISSWKDGFWDGANYEFISGVAKGRTGQVEISAHEGQHQGLVIHLGTHGITPQAGDYLILRKIRAGNAQAGWWPTAVNGGSISTETKDLPPGTAGKQAIHLSCSQGGEAGISAYFDGTPERSFLRLRGDYLLRFRAKATGGLQKLRVSISRNTAPMASRYFVQSFDLSGRWTDYSLQIEIREAGHERGALEVSFLAMSSDVLLDDVSFEENTPSNENPTVFRDSVVAALKQLNPGILRFWGGQLGDTVENQIAPSFGRMRSGYSSWHVDTDEIQYGLNDFLALCKAVGAEPYYVLPTTLSTEEMRHLVEFLGGSNQTRFGQKRATLGRENPWTEEFKTIHLEFGNEAWNPTFAGGNIEDPVAYGNRAGELFAAARAADGFVPERFDLVLGGQAVNLPRNRSIVSAASYFDSFSIAPYLMERVDSYATNEKLFQPLFAEPQSINSRSGYICENLDLLRQVHPSARLVAYELNANTVEGSITQEALDNLIPSVGTGLAVIENMLLMIRNGIRDQMLWSLPQYSFRRGDGKIAKLFGAVVDMGVTDRKRPQYLAMALANGVLSGDLLETRQTGPDPTWDVHGENGITYKHAHAIQSFAFTSGATRSLILLNLEVQGALDVTFTGVNAPKGFVRVRQLKSTSINANNETADQVSTVERTSETFDPKDIFLLPPYSMTVLSWKVAH